MGAGAGAGATATSGGDASPSSKAGGKNNGVRNYLVSLQGWHKNHIPLPDSFWLRISLESLDFVHRDSLVPLVQFPFQNILCWGSNAKVFQFSVFDVDNCLVGRAPDTIPIYLRSTEGKDIEKYLMETVRRLMADMEAVHTVTKDEFRTLRNLLFNMDSMGNREQTVPDPASSPSSLPSSPSASAKQPSSSSSSSSSSSPNAPTATTSAADDAPQLREDWLQVIDQFSLDRKLLAKQAMELLLLIGPLQPFEKFDLAVLLSGRILNTESLQLVINTFEDAAERENLILRLGLERKDLRGKTAAFTPDCKIMAEFVPVPGSPVRSVRKSLESRGEDEGGSCKEAGAEEEQEREQEQSPRPNYGS